MQVEFTQVLCIQTVCSRGFASEAHSSTEPGAPGSFPHIEQCFPSSRASAPPPPGYRALPEATSAFWCTKPSAPGSLPHRRQCFPNDRAMPHTQGHRALPATTCMVVKGTGQCLQPPVHGGAQSLAPQVFATHKAGNAPPTGQRLTHRDTGQCLRPPEHGGAQSLVPQRFPHTG
eukprot:scaffold43873_cov19-Tisochrysis_lutea.AAC.2